MIDGKPSVNDNPTFDPIIEHLSEVIHEDDTVLIPENIDLIKILPDDLDSFYHYSGSLTTPTCDEVVTWTIFSKPNTMSRAQLQQFRTLTNDGTTTGHLSQSNYHKLGVRYWLVAMP